MTPEDLNARGVRVRDLEWVVDGDRSFFGNGLFSYQVRHSGNGVWKWTRFNSGTWYFGGPPDGAMDELGAKAAAQADYESRILAALETVPHGRDE